MNQLFLCIVSVLQEADLMVRVWNQNQERGDRWIWNHQAGKIGERRLWV